LLITTISLPADLMFSRMFPIAGVIFIVLNCLLLFALGNMAKRQCSDV